jgi:hypothetical protein
MFLDAFQRLHPGVKLVKGALSPKLLGFPSALGDSVREIEIGNSIRVLT